MLIYILRTHVLPNDYTAELFRQFKQTPGLMRAYWLQGEEDPSEALVITVWESRQAAEDYLNKSSLRQQVDRTVPDITRTFYRVLDYK